MTEEFDSGTSSGYLMLTMLSGFATHEREVIHSKEIQKGRVTTGESSSDNGPDRGTIAPQDFEGALGHPSPPFSGSAWSRYRPSSTPRSCG